MKSHLLSIAIVLAIGLLLLIGVAMAIVEIIQAHRISRRSPPTAPTTKDHLSISTADVIERNKAAIERIDQLLAGNFLYPRW